MIDAPFSRSGGNGHNVLPFASFRLLVLRIPWCLACIPTVFNWQPEWGVWDFSSDAHQKAAVILLQHWRQRRKPGFHVAITRVVLVLDHISPPLTGGSTDAAAAVLLHPCPLLSTGLCLVYSGRDTFFSYCCHPHRLSTCSIILLALWPEACFYTSLLVYFLFYKCI